jgi:large subunit ribosomal protein L10
MLLAKLAGGMKASMARAAAVMSALPVQMAQLSEALRVKLEAEGGASAAADASASTEASTPEASTPEATASDDGASGDSSTEDTAAAGE